MGAVGSPCRVARLGPTAQAPPSLATLQGLPPAPITRAPSPQGVGSQKVGANNKSPVYYSPLQSPLLLGSTKAGAMADGAAIAPASPPPTPKGVDFFSLMNGHLKVVGGGGYNWVHTIISIFDAPNPGLAALEPLHRKLRGEV